nr:unnamed protein product [Rangifer tarandus platyrhynchus]
MLAADGGAGRGLGQRRGPERRALTAQSRPSPLNGPLSPAIEHCVRAPWRRPATAISREAGMRRAGPRLGTINGTNGNEVVFEESLECVVGGVVQAGGPLGVEHAASAEAAGGTPGVRTPGLAASAPRAAQAHTEGTRSREGSKDRSSSAHARSRPACTFSAAELGWGVGTLSTWPSAWALTA